jgi:SAM-dependent methyltransferase
VRGAIREVFAHELRRFGPDFPAGHEYRKHWEVAMAAMTLERCGALHPGAEVLGVGAGNEPTVFWLTRRVRRVFATDLYMDAGVWHEFAPASMLTDPGIHWPFEWNRRRLVVQHMDALELRYEDRSFDAVFSSSSLEHFGGLAEARRSMEEAFRVLRPGGVLTLATEFRVQGPPPGLPGCLMFDEAEIREHLLGDLAWELVSPLRTAVSDATVRSAVEADDQMEDLRRHCEAHRRWALHELEFSRYPQVAMRHGEHVWTSVHLALRRVA